ncbi:homeodomain-like protein [Tanacetum coccineum]
MTHKDPNNKPAVTIRRSPRFQQIVVYDHQGPITPNPEQRIRPRVPSSATPLTRRKRLRSNNSKQSSEKTKDGSKRCTRSESFVEECDAEKVSNQRKRESERRVTRSCCFREVDKNADKADYGVNVAKQLKGKSVRNKGKHNKRSCDGDSDKFENDDNKNEMVLAVTEKKDLNEELLGKCVDKRTDVVGVSTAIVVYDGLMGVKDGNKAQTNVGVKRKRNESGGSAGNGNSQSWTKDQELTLERAYLEAKPTPHFWKKVSRLVPGKSAQDCFDKIHGSHMTPPQPPLRSRARVTNTQNTSFSVSKLLNSSSPTTKRPRSRKQKSHVVQRTVRHMLQNQYKAEQDSEQDLFSALEPTFTPSINFNLMLTTPDRSPDEVLRRFQERSSTAHKKSVSRFSSSYGTTLVSPPVLKQVKNKAMHEKYIDQLNCREANRKAACAKAEKLCKGEAMKEEGSVQRKNAIKAAKNALLFGARDAINEFQHQQGTVLSDLFDEEVCGDNDEDEEENGQVLF